tara:strand:- start:248 stop:793 length:546 start_codon:yes stop_codon:yes gene_type:complete
MKNFYKLSALALTLAVVSCSKDDDEPEHVHEHEVMTTMNVTLTSSSGNVTLSFQDLDIDGPNPPSISVSGNLSSETLYMGSIEILNETETPPENVTTEIIEENDEHQFFFTLSSGLEVDISTTDSDSNGNPLGQQFNLQTHSPGSGTLTITLIHEPNKPNSGLSSAGGATDIEVTFNLVVE